MYLNLDITFEEGTLILKLLDKRDSIRFCYKLFTKIKNTPLKCGIIVYGLLSTMNQIAYSPNAGISGNELYI